MGAGRLAEGGGQTVPEKKSSRGVQPSLECPFRTMTAYLPTAEGDVGLEKSMNGLAVENSNA